MSAGRMSLRSRAAAVGAVLFLTASALSAQQGITETRDPGQKQDANFAKFYAEWTTQPRFGSPLVDHLPLASGVPTPKDVLGYYIGAPKTLTYYADILKYYRALEKASRRVKIETIGKSDEGRELVVVWISSENNIKNLAANRANLAKIADPRGLSEAQVNRIITQTKPHYHLMGGLHSGETGPSEMLMELAYRLVVETSPLISQIRDNMYVSITPAAEPDGRDRNVDWFYRGLDMGPTPPADTAGRAGGAGREGGGGGGGGGRGGTPGVPYWGKYVYHDNNRDINLSQLSMRAITDWYFTAHPPIMHDLHESLTLLYTYSGGPPQNPNLDPILFGELSWFANYELSQMTKFGMPGVYTHAFMDGWSPGYLGSVSYNHNGMMKMYETQSGRDVPADSLELYRNPKPPVVAAAAADSAGRGGNAGRGAGDGGGRGRGRGAGGGRGAAGDSAAAGRGNTAPATPAAANAGRGGGGIPTGRGGGQEREWYRGIPVPPNAVQHFTRRNNTNYMQTGVLSALQLTSQFPQLVLQNFYVKTKNSIEAGRTQAPYGYAFPVQREMTRVVNLVNIMRAQGIEVGQLNAALTIGADTLPAGSYVVKLDQPYGRLAKNLLEKQDYPDAALRTYDDSGWTMGYALDVDVREIKDKAILDARVTPVEKGVWRGKFTGTGNAGVAVAHLGSTNMITFRYALKDVPMKVAEASFTAEGVTFPAGSFIISGAEATQRARALADSLGLTAAALTSVPTVATHDADVPRIAIYSQWSGTQELGWYRHAFDRFGIPFDLIYKERVVRGNLRADYDVILMAAQTITRANVMQAPAARAQPYKKTDKFKFLGMYGETDDMTGGFGQRGVEAFEQFLERGGTLITTLAAVRFPIEFGFARTVDTETPAGVNAQKPLIKAEITKPNHPVFYGYEKKTFPIKFGQGAQVFRVGIADQDRVLAQYVGGDSSVLSGLMVGAGNIRGRAFAVDVPRAHNGRGRVLMFANNPIYRWQNHGEFNMVFNSIINWNDVPGSTPVTVGMAAPRERPASVPCPWPTANTTQPTPTAGGPQRFPDCAPPGWTPPAQLAPHNPPALPADRPRPIVDDYLKYVVTAPPAEIVKRLNLDTAFYKKYADANGYPILASAKVPDAALAIVRDQVNYMLAHRPDVRDTMIARGARIGIMAETEYTMDVPEQRNWSVPRYLDPRLTPGERASYYEPGGLGSRSAEGYWNPRARGMGGTFTTCAEENVLGYYNTRYWGTNICVHEFAHGIMGAGIGNADPGWFQEIVDAYKAAKAACGPDGQPGRLTARGYAGNTFNEYWATGVEWYVGNGGRDRAALRAADPYLYELITRLIPENKVLPVRANVANRTREEMAQHVRLNNPEWWQREQEREAARQAARSGGAGRGGNAGRGGAANNAGRGATAARGGGGATAPCGVATN